MTLRRFSARFAFVALPLLTALPAPAFSAAPDKASILATPLELRKSKFDLRHKDVLPALIKALEEEIDYYTPLRDEKKDAKKEAKDASKPAADKPNLKSVVKELKEMRRTAKAMQDGKTPYEAGARKMLELDWSMRDEFRQPYIAWPSLEMTQFAYRFRHLTLNGVGRGNAAHPARNLTSYSAPDLSRVDPGPSTFWYPPTAVAEKDLYYGYDRKSIPSIAGQVCKYDGPHTGYGAHCSFDVLAPDGSKWRTKFGEESSGPFGSRLLWALGYPAQIADYSPEVRVKWNRRIFTEFNFRNLNSIRIQFAGLTLTEMTDAGFQDPIPYVKYAVMKDGSHISSKDLERGLFSSVLPPAPAPTRKRKVYDYASDRWITVMETLPRPAHPYTDPRNYNEAFEAKVNYLVFRDANLRTKDKEADGGVDQFGGWSFNFLDHADLRELRGMAMLHGWLDNWDIRPGNNRLLMISDDNGARLEHEISDMGALFGNSSGLIRIHQGAPRAGLFQNEPNGFTWIFTHPQPPGESTVPVCNFMPITMADPFYRMNMDDARWMARLIGQLTENQIKQGLIGAGLDAATGRLLLEKLASRRDHMLQDLGLDREIPLWRPKGENRKLNYDPAKDGPFTATLSDGSTVFARIDSERMVVGGMLKIRKSTTIATAVH